MIQRLLQVNDGLKLGDDPATTVHDVRLRAIAATHKCDSFPRILFTIVHILIE